MKTNIESIKNKLFKFVETVIEKMKYNTSFFYYFICGFTIFGLMFFFGSNALFSDAKKEVRSTNLNEIQHMNSLNAKLISRQYNPLTKTIEYIVYAEDGSNIDNKEIVFELREQKNPNIIIETRKQIIDKNYYVVLAKVPKKWNVLSLSMGYKVDDLSQDPEDISVKDIDHNDKNKTLMSVIRFYSDRDDIKESSFLKEKGHKEYLGSILDLEVQFINKEIVSLGKQIEENKQTITDAKNKINELESAKEFQTESEINQSDVTINRLEGLIGTTKSKVEDDTKKSNELKQKIKKLQEKKSITTK